MSQPRRLTDSQILAWARLAKASARLIAAVERDLKAAGLPPLAWYDALLELRRAGEAGLRPGELQTEMLLPQYNVSRLIDRLEAAGLAERRAVAGDARAQSVHITAAGRAMLKVMWPVYEKTLATHFGARLEEGDAERLAAILKPLA